MDWKAEAVEKLRGYEANKRRLGEAATRCPVSKLGTPANPQASADFPLHGSDGETAPAGHGEPSAPICVADVDLEALELEQARLWVAIVDSGLEVLDPDGRLVLEALDIYRAKGNAARLQEVLSISSPTTIYKRREKALQLFTMALYGVDIAKGPPR